MPNQKRHDNSVRQFRHNQPHGLDDVIYGSGPNEIFGTNLNDNGQTRPKLMGTNGVDHIYGRNGDDIIYGLDGNDLLDGGAGIDAMYGGKGNDTYVVTGAGGFVDTVVERASEGIDTVKSFVSYTLGANVENLELQSRLSLPGSPPFDNNLNGTGNSLNNRITGNIGNNILNGLNGDDIIKGGIGTDSLYGGAGTDLLDGGTGADIMNGGTGNDTYYVDNVGDSVIESSSAMGGFSDRVILQAVIDYTLTDFVENLSLVSNSTAAQNGTGNSLSNEIVGGLGTNTLSGLAGNDRLYGMAGNDQLLGGDGNDLLVGTDSKTKGQGAIDTLTGGAGSDTFVLGQALSPSGSDYYNDGNAISFGTSDYALITDFTIGEDQIQLIQNSSRYRITDVTLGSVTGAGIYVKGNMLVRSELIGVVQGVAAADLSLTSDSFTYDQYQPPQ